MTHLPILFGYHASNIGNSHVPISLCRYWHESGRAVKLSVPSTDVNINYPWLHPVMTGLKKTLVYKLGSESLPRNLTETEFLKSEMVTPLVYLWAGLSLEVFERFNRNGTKIIIERINCHRATSRRILKNAEQIFGITSRDSISDEEIAIENRKLEIADAIFCPSPMVRNSMLENGVPEAKLLSTSYVWAPERFTSRSLVRPENSKPVFLFVGRLCLRKGLPLLLEAWQLADIDGELLLCGAVDKDIQSNFSEQLSGRNVRYVPYTKDVGEIYNQADVFVFPSLEEGGPMVTYEAMAHGITPLVTSMGAGAIVQDGINGVILPDTDVGAWVDAIRDIAGNKQKRITLGEKARERAQEFTWSNVAEQRVKLLEERYPELWK
jgi:glycosyltransferase involved in cell wall biosynthesis